jgi:hypothetical protein
MQGRGGKKEKRNVTIANLGVGHPTLGLGEALKCILA